MNRKELVQRAMFAMEGAAQQDGWAGAADALFDAIGAALKRGERVELRGFGTFSVVETKARPGRNPRTGNSIRIPPGRRVRFKPAKSLLG
jgi:nucleoid DNA-binding protein